MEVQNVLNATNGSNLESFNTQNLSFKHIEDLSTEPEKDEIKLLDKIISEYGYRFQIIKIIIISIFLNFITSFVIYHVSSYLLVIEKELKTETTMSQENLGIMLSCICYSFRAFGCFTFIFIVKSFSRRTLIFFSLSIIFSLNVLITIKLNLWTYLAFLIFGCFCAGIIDPITLDVLCESLPIRLRGFFMCLYSLGAPLSQTSQFIFLKIIYDESKNNFQMVLLTGTLLILLLIILIIIFFEDSPRNLIVTEDLSRAYSQLEKMQNPPRSLTDSEKNTLYTQIHYGLNNLVIKDFSSIFSPLFLRTTLIFIGIIICFKSVDDGISAVLTLYLQKILGTSDQKLIGLDGTKIYLISSLAPLLSGVLIEIKFLGRKFTLMITAVLLLISYFLFHVNLSNYILWLGLLNVFTNSSSCIVFTLITETYPTKLRDISEGFFSCIGAIGSLIGNMAFMSIFKLGMNAPFYLQIGNSIISLVLVYFIKYETCQKELDVYFNNNNKYLDKDMHDDNNKEEMKSFV